MNEVRVSEHTLDNGLKLAVETSAADQSVALGVWVRCGARYEPPPLNGISHFLEHMVFKGSARRDALALSQELESLGGQFDAYTTHEATCYTFHVLPEHLERAVDLLADLMLESVFSGEAVATEQKVVTEEILESDESPTDLVQELAARQVWGDHPLGQPVLGTVPTVSSFTADQVAAYRASHYTAERLTVAAAGAADGDAVAAAFANSFAAMPARGEADLDSTPWFHSGAITRRLDLDQIHLCLALPAVSAMHEDRYALWVVEALLGGTMSSRLFQEVRERRGLVYHIGTTWQSYADCGMLAIEAIAAVKQVTELLKVVRGEIERVVAEGLSQEELSWVKEYARTTTALGAETVSARMGRLARSYFYEDRYVPVSEVLERIDAVTLDEVLRVAGELLGNGQRVLAAVGPVTARRADTWWQAVGG